MASAKEIRTKIRSVQNTQKITKAMEMVAASKMRRAQDRMKATRPYTEKMREVVSHVAAANAEYKHPYLVKRETVKRVGYVVVTTDRGLCGGLNVNLFKKAVADMRQWHEAGVDVDVAVYGRKGAGFFRRLPVTLVAESTNLGDKPMLTDVIGPLKAMIDAYTEGKIDRLFLVSNDFVNTMTQSANVHCLLPAEPTVDEQYQRSWDYLYEPDAESVLDELLNRYLESLTYQAVVENVACEMAARMVAMKSSSDNAGNIISELQLVYNKARQAAITQEIAEIVGGAAAV